MVIQPLRQLEAFLSEDTSTVELHQRALPGSHCNISTEKRTASYYRFSSGVTGPGLCSHAAAVECRAIFDRGSSYTSKLSLQRGLRARNNQAVLTRLHTTSQLIDIGAALDINLVLKNWLAHVHFCYDIMYHYSRLSPLALLVFFKGPLDAMRTDEISV